MSVRYLKSHHVSVCMSECEGAADALMMLIIHTADVRPAAEALPLGNARTRSSFIVVKKHLCVLQERLCSLGLKV